MPMTTVLPTEASALLDCIRDAGAMHGVSDSEVLAKYGVPYPTTFLAKLRAVAERTHTGPDQ